MSEMLPPIVVELLARTGEFKSKMGEAGSEVKRFEAVSSSALNKASTVGKFALLGLAGAAGIVGVESLKSAGDFQQSTNLFVTAAGETTGGLAVVRDGIKSIATETGTTWQNLSEGMYTVEKAGYRGADGVQVLRAAAQGAAEEGASLSSVTNAMTSVMASYNLKASDSVGVMNAVKTASGGTKDTMENFASSLSSVIPIASANKISFGEIGGALGTLTQAGTTAMQATQELQNTISNLAAPNAVATKMMASFGIAAQDVTTNLGTDKRGLAGTLDMLSNTVLQRMGPAGTALLNTFQTSKAASAALATELAAMAPDTRKLAQDFQSGAINAAAYRKGMVNMTGDQKNLASQFRTTYNRANGFNQAIKNGGSAAVTYTAAIKAMTGGSTGLNTTLMLTGSNMDGFKERTAATTKSLNAGGTAVEGWDSTQKLFNVQMARLSQSVQVAAIDIGTKLIPVVLAVGGFIADNKGPFLALAGVIGGALVVAIGVYVANLTIAAAKSVVSFARMIAGGVAWAASQAASMAETAALWAMYSGQWLAARAATMAAWVTSSAAAAASWLATQAATMAAWVATSAASAAAWLAAQATALATSIASAAVWSASLLASAAVAAAGWLVSMAGMAATAVASAAAMILPFLPLILVIGAIGLAAYALYENWDTVWGFITRIASDAWGWLQGVFNSLVQGGIWVIRSEIQYLSDMWSWAWNGISDAVSGAWNFISGIFDNITNAVGGVISALGSITSAASSVGSFLNIPGFASGVTNFSGGLAVVGENGPELVNLPRGSDVIPTGKVGAMMSGGRPLTGGSPGGGGGGTNVYLTVQGSVYGPGGVTALADQIHEALLRKQARSPLGIRATA